MDRDITFSLCICTRNRPDDLRRCLEAVAAGDRVPDQVIVSDDGDEGKTVEQVAGMFSFVTYQRGPRIGLGANRNACIARVTSRLVNFIDDDVVLPRAYVTEAIEAYQKYAQSNAKTIVTGIQRDHNAQGSFLLRPGNSDFWGYQRLDPQGTYRAVVINSTIFPASLFRRALFDEQLRYGSDEIDIARHAVSLGYRIFHEPSLCVDHYPSTINRREYASVIDASRMYATAKAYWSYEGNPLKAVVYCALAVPKLAWGLGRRFGFEGISAAWSATVKASQYALHAARSRS